ncbi:response regulator transcription factor [Novosphingobium album (ex Hu et al. 2023)]|uniref:Response regulator transcription factor n=1 Tax=Novosphingobium album (ex Hu et al. 2023) TaxID=2930093 RepID=A0ABT0B1E1_9SPHN|nr:response regulator transcription factor [Novosphingobium album (ex Hu et al. 2023)]MCJ2178604.1 response regulator transcription factor [Novosphingobium album (ex Hu et al. 2023)]
MSNFLILSLDKIFISSLSIALEDGGFKVIGAAESLFEINDFATLRDCIAIFDCPDAGNQFEVLKEIRSQFPSVRVVVFSSSFHLELTTECLAHGASGYLLRSLEASVLVEALRLIAQGETAPPSRLKEVMATNPIRMPSSREAAKDHKKRGLLPRQWGMFHHWREGNSNNDIIARALHACEATVKVHVHNILHKLHAYSRAQAAIRASSNGPEGPSAHP